MTNKNTGRRNNRRYRLRGLQLAAVSFAMMALADFSVHVIRSFEKSYIAEFIYIGVTFVSWIMMFAGTRMIAEYERNYRQAFFATLPALAAGMIWIVSALYDVQSGMGHHTFTSAGVMFMSYICFLCMLYAYTHILNGSAAIMEDHNKLNLQRKCVRVWKPCFVLIILALICIQGAPLFSELIKYIITGAATLITLLAEMIMIRNILAVYEQMDGERISVRMDDLISRITAEDTGEKTEELADEEPMTVSDEGVTEIIEEDKEEESEDRVSEITEEEPVLEDADAVEELEPEIEVADAEEEPEPEIEVATDDTDADTDEEEEDEPATEDADADEESESEIEVATNGPDAEEDEEDEEPITEDAETEEEPEPEIEVATNGPDADTAEADEDEPVTEDADAEDEEEDEAIIDDAAMYDPIIKINREIKEKKEREKREREKKEEIIDEEKGDE